MIPALNRCLIVSMFCLLGIWVWTKPGWGYDWPGFKKEFISSDGRVIDFYQNQISHSEGQGYSMILAVMHRDRAAFDLLWHWTRDNLQVREKDRLLAWSWGEKQPGIWTVIDANNATDGDLCVTFALLLAARIWRSDDYQHEALKILGSIEENLVKEKNGLLCLLPGIYGFVKEKGLVLNPSYFVFSAFIAFAAQENQTFWDRLQRDCQTLLTRCLDPETGLPPDWFRYDGHRVTANDAAQGRFGFDAVRVLLFLAWDHNMRLIPDLDRHLAHCRTAGYVPAWVEPGTGGPSRDEAPAGFYAVYARAARELGRDAYSRYFQGQADRKIGGEEKDYYSKILYLLSKVEFVQ